MIAFDATTLILHLSPDAKGPQDPETGLPVIRIRDRIQYLIDTLEKKKTKIIIPAPALSELLVLLGDNGSEILMNINKSGRFRICSFDQRAAIELSEVTRQARSRGDKRDGSRSAWQKVKFDRQIVAIAKVENASAIYTDDDDVVKFAAKVGMAAVRIVDLPLPPEDAQGVLALEPPKQIEADGYSQVSEEETPIISDDCAIGQSSTAISIPADSHGA